MSCISQTRIARWQSELAIKIAQLEIVRTAIEELTAKNTKEYWLDTGEGKQRVTRRDLSELTKREDQLEATIDSLYAKLERRGVININLRRKAGPCS